jgi:hypothetical protein
LDDELVCLVNRHQGLLAWTGSMMITVFQVETKTSLQVILLVLIPKKIYRFLIYRGVTPKYLEAGGLLYVYPLNTSMYFYFKIPNRGGGIKK